MASYIQDLYQTFELLKAYATPWHLSNALPEIIERLIAHLPPEEYRIRHNVAIHKEACIEENVVIRDFVLIGAGSVVKAGAYLRAGVLLGKEVVIGANCEIKQSLIFHKSRIAHLNYVGNSVLGEDVNLEAGAVLANHFNERQQKKITVLVAGETIETGCSKFGSLLGDGCRIGANAVLNPGTILQKGSIVGRLTHVDQLKSVG